MNKEGNKMNPENKCAHLWNQAQEMPEGNSLEAMFKMQASLQKRIGNDPADMDFKQRVDFIKENWNYLTCEYAELLERLPFKTWKKYTPEQLADFENEEHKLETWFEVCDMMHFFINMCLCLGITADDMARLYYAKNKENFDRQDRGY